MKKIIKLILLGLILNSCNSKNNAILTLSNYKLNFDTILAKKSKTINLKLTNTGNQNLIIYDYQTSCECTFLNLSKMSIIKPNDSLNLKITLTGFTDDIGKWKRVLCTFKSNSDSIFTYLNIRYFTN